MCVCVCVCVCVYLGHQPLVLTEPGLSHGGLAVETSRQHLQLLLANQLVPQGQLTLMLRLLQTLPRLSTNHNTRQVDIIILRLGCYRFISSYYNWIHVNKLLTHLIHTIHIIHMY